jgi:NAD(P)-dependent dehydrogenase (short-subunit alcohol dehydrogenase family)
MQISGSSAVVVGGTGGLGEATVRRLHGAGAKVVIADVADDKGKALESELGVRYLHTDATSEDEVNAALSEAESLAPLRVAVDCHGGPASGGRLVGKDGSPLDLEGFKTTIDFYLTAVFNVLRLSAAAIARQEPLDTGSRGVVVTTASIAGYEGQIGQICYSAAKGGVIGMTLVAARDLSPLGIRRAHTGQFPSSSSTRTGAQRSHSRNALGGRTSTRRWLPASSRTITSTAKSFALMERCASHRSNRTTSIPVPYR